MWKLKLFFSKNMMLELNDVRSGNPGWADCCPTKIEKIEFPFIGVENGKTVPYTLCLAGMSEYNFFVEAMRAIGVGSTIITSLWFLSKIPNTNRITGFKISSTVQIVNSVIGKEYSGFSTVGWKLGEPGGKVISVIRREL